MRSRVPDSERMRTTDTFETMSRSELLDALADGLRAGDATLADVQGEVEAYESWLDERAREAEADQVAEMEMEMERKAMRRAIQRALVKERIENQAVIPPGLSMFTGVDPLPPREKTIKRRVLILESWIEREL